MTNPNRVRFSLTIPGTLRRCFQRLDSEPELPSIIERHTRETFVGLADPDVDARFAATQLPQGRILVSGACDWSAALIAAIEAEAPDKTIVAVVDRRAAVLREQSGYPVLTAADAAREPFDYALVCSPIHELSMAQDLREAGIPANRIVALRALDAFRAFQSAAVEDAVPQLLKRIHERIPHVENVILHPSRDIWSVVADRELADVFAPETTVRLYTGYAQHQEVSETYASFDIRRSFALLESVLRFLAPTNIYIRGSAQFQAQHLGVAVRRTFPDAFLAVEVYDYMCMFEDGMLSDWGFTPESIELNRCAEVFLARHADFIIDKTPGDQWEALAGELFDATRRCYFPRVTSSAAAPAAARHGDNHGSPVCRLLNAGTLPSFHRLRPGQAFADSAFQDIITPIERLSQEADIRIDLFNSGHTPGSTSCEAAFGGYRDYFDPDRVGYYPYLPFADLMARFGEYDYGILIFAPTSMPIDYPLQQSLPNRLASYIAGGLPIIVNKELHYFASLVEAFDAGITVHADQIGDLPIRIRQADRAGHRAGALRLKAFMTAHNESALRTLRAAVAEGAASRTVRSNPRG